MSLIHLPSGHKRNAVMPRVSWRTLILMVELLVAVVAFQYLTMAQPAQATAIWLAGDCHTAASVQQGMAAPAATPVATGAGAIQP